MEEPCCVASLKSTISLSPGSVGRLPTPIVGPSHQARCLGRGWLVLLPARRPPTSPLLICLLLVAGTARSDSGCPRAQQSRSAALCFLQAAQPFLTTHQVTDRSPTAHLAVGGTVHSRRCSATHPTRTGAVGLAAQLGCVAMQDCFAHVSTPLSLPPCSHRRCRACTSTGPQALTHWHGAQR